MWTGMSVSPCSSVGVCLKYFGDALPRYFRSPYQNRLWCGCSWTLTPDYETSKFNYESCGYLHFRMSCLLKWKFLNERSRDGLLSEKKKQIRCPTLQKTQVQSHLEKVCSELLSPWAFVAAKKKNKAEEKTACKYTTKEKCREAPKREF